MATALSTDARRVVRGACPHDCPDTCSTLVTVEGSRAVSIAGDPDHPFTSGFLCAKVNRYVERTYHRDRLTTPLRRVGRKGEGKFEPATWDEALDLMAEKFTSAIRDHGPESVALFGSGQWTIWEGYAASKLFKAGLRTNNIDPNARHCMASAVAGFMLRAGELRWGWALPGFPERN